MSRSRERQKARLPRCSPEQCSGLIWIDQTALLAPRRRAFWPQRMRENKSDSLPDLRFSLNHTGFAGSDKGPPARGFALARAVYSRHMSPNVYPVRIVMLRRRTAGRWAGETCEAVAVLPGVADDAPGVEPLVTLHGESRYLVRGLALDLHRDEAEGYYLNVSAAEPKVFVIVRPSGVTRAGPNAVIPAASLPASSRTAVRTPVSMSIRSTVQGIPVRET